MFALGAGPVPALILPELFADRIRAKALSVAMCVHWVSFGFTLCDVLYALIRVYDSYEFYWTDLVVIGYSK